MKIKIDNYTFNKSAQTITFTDYTTIRLDSLLLITNVTDNIIVYNFASPLLGGTVSGNVLTLTYDTSAMDDTDSLQIFYDDPEVQPANEELQTSLYSLTETLQDLVARLAVIASMANAGQPALRTIPVGTTAISGAVTVASTSITNFGTGVPAKEVADDINNMMVTLANINNAVAA